MENIQSKQRATVRSSRKGKNVEEEEFEVYVRSSHNTLCQDIKEIKDGQAKGTRYRATRMR